MTAKNMQLLLVMGSAVFLVYVGICGILTLLISVFITGGYPINGMPDYLQFIIKDVLLYCFNNLRAHIAFIIPFVFLAEFFAVLFGVCIIVNVIKAVRKHE